MSADTIEPQPPLDWMPEVFRNTLARDDDGILYRIDWSVPGGRWVPVSHVSADQPSGDA
jgi:hypothetical protein